jgi:potassium-transporting ATPase potassium-binding subunit
MPVTVNSVVQVLAYLVLLLLITKPMGLYMLNVFSGKYIWLTPVFAPVERLFYRLCGINAEKEQKWSEYTIAMLLFSAAGMLLLYIEQRTQQWLPLNPQGFGAVEPQLAFNTAASFTSNTNWQAYTGEQTMSYLTQMMGLAFHN